MVEAVREDLPSYGADFIATDEERERLDQRRKDFAESTPWKIDDIEITDPTSLLGALMTRNARDLAWTRDCIEDGLRRDIVAFARWREVVIEGLVELCRGPYAPNPMMILKILDHDGGMLDITAEQYLKDQESD